MTLPRGTPAEIDERIVITGLGAVSAVGIGSRETFASLVAGRSGIDRITRFDPSGVTYGIAGEVKGFDPLAYMEAKQARRIGRYAQFALAATNEALCSARLDLAAEDRDRVAAVIGSSIGDFPLLEEQIYRFRTKGPGSINPFTVPRVSSSMASAQVSLVHGLTGPSFGLASACATGSHSIAAAWMLLKAGLADVALAGATDAPISPSFVDAYAVMGVLAKQVEDPARASRPFDRDRTGFVVAEGCAVLVLETTAHARARGATILAELAGIGMSCDAHHVTACDPEGRGAARAMTLALHSAGLDASQVDYINAHGTSTVLNDAAETRAIKAALGEHAHLTPVSSIKSMIGHAIGGAGALEAMTCVMALNYGVIPPTINLDNADPVCDLDYVPGVARRRDLRVVMSNSFAFGGQNCVLVFRHPERAQKTSASDRRPA